MFRMGILWACCVLSAPTFAGDSANWPAWRGDGSGVSFDSNLPVEWGPTKGIIWKTRIEGQGISSPIVWEDKVFLTTAVEGSEAVLSRTTVLGLGGGLLVLAVVSGTDPGWLSHGFLEGQRVRVCTACIRSGKVVK